MAEQTETERGEGVAYLLRKRGGPTVDHGQAARGRFRWAGEYWQAAGGGWGPVETARYYTATERAEIDPATVGGEWVAVFVAVAP